MINIGCFDVRQMLTSLNLVCQENVPLPPRGATLLSGLQVESLHLTGGARIPGCDPIVQGAQSPSLPQAPQMCALFPVPGRGLQVSFLTRRGGASVASDAEGEQSRSTGLPCLGFLMALYCTVLSTAFPHLGL